MKKTLLLLVTMIFMQKTFAGDKILNGGNVIVCANSVELLDYYEARLSGTKLQYNPNLTTYSEKLQDLFKRWTPIAPKRMALYTKWLSTFTDEAGIYSGIEIPDILDTGSVAIPNGCKMTPVAFQRRDEDIFPGEKRYVVNKDLWDRMDENQKAGLVLHEIIYREAITNVHSTSLPTRFLNRFLATEVTPSSKKYFNVIYKMPMAWAEYSGMILKIGSVSCSGGFGQDDSCRFRYEGLLNEEKIDAEILSVYGNIKIEDLTIDFDGISSCENTSKEQRKIEYSFKEEWIAFSSCNKIKNISIKDRLSLTDIKNLWNFLFQRSVIGGYGYYSEKRITVNPSTSWIATKSGNRLEQIKAVNKDDYNMTLFQTADDKFFQYNGSSDSYEETIFNFALKENSVSCNKHSSEISSFVCPKLPKKISCFVRIIDPKVYYYATEAVSLTLVNNIIHDESYRGDEKADREYSILVPKGQVIGYTKKFRKLEPIVTESERLINLNWNKSDDCEVKI